MNVTRRPVQHSSYLSHRRQVLWQIILPVVLAALLMAGLIVLITLSTFRGNGDVSRWAAISTIWLVIPVIIAGLVLLVLLVVVIALLARIIGLIPPYTHQAQKFAHRIEAGVARVAEMARKPTLLLQELGVLIRRVIARARERM
jgi:hypothetical protein